MRHLFWPLLGVAYALYYAGSCVFHPLRDCRCCGGRGKHYRRDGKAHRRCLWCRGEGEKWRLGRRVWDHFAKVRAAAGGRR